MSYQMRSQSGFTLLEVLVVVVIIGVLAALVGPAIMNRVDSAREVAAQQQIESLRLALENYRLDAGRYPTTEQGLADLWEQPSLPPIPGTWNGPYLQKEPRLDPWGKAYVYQHFSQDGTASYELFTSGPEGAL